jgi:hypothetical protein
MAAHRNIKKAIRFMALTLHARALLALATLVIGAVSAFAADEPAFCKQLASLADAGNDGRFHQVRLVWKKDADRVACSGEGKAEKRFCRWFTAQPEHIHWISMSQEALTCLGQDPLPPSDPDEFVIHSWWSRGGFPAKSGPLLRERVEFTMDMDLEDEAGPWWLLFTARPR